MANKVSSTETKEYTPMEELASYHQEIEEKYKGVHVHPDDISINNLNTSALMAFNGYYSMTHAKGAFFTIDTNMYIKEGSSSPIFDLTLLISMDGITSVRIPYFGTFDDNHLKQGLKLLGSYKIDLTFVRTDKNDGSVATFSGTIAPRYSVPVVVQGTTYNNPIHCSVFEGEYSSNESVSVVHLHKNYKISYDYGSGTGNLENVPSYTYNLNMYFFSFSKGVESIRFIMGTAAAHGLVCNNMIVNAKGKVSQRTLQTIQHPKQEPKGFPNLNSNYLAAFSGYYQLTSVSEKAFISIQAEYATITGRIDAYVVLIGISMDGKTSTGYQFNEKDMSFENDTLTMKDQNITLTFKRKYKLLQQGSLVSISGSVNGTFVNGYTYFNPVPLSVFGGVTMTDAKKSQLIVVNDNSLKFNGTLMDKILYVPIMYILAYPTEKPTTIMSFGTDGRKGNTCIVTDTSGVSVFYAIDM